MPIPGAQQHKRPRRRYEEIERMYKCGHQGCEKAYGTLNHLNAHVTMQSHGVKRTPEGEFVAQFCILIWTVVAKVRNRLVELFIGGRLVQLHSINEAHDFPLALTLTLVAGDGLKRETLDHVPSLVTSCLLNIIAS